MNRKELVDAIARETGLPRRNTELAVRAFVNIVSEELRKGERVQQNGFGSMEVSESAVQAGINPHTGETVGIHSSAAPKFKAGKALKDLVNGKK